MKWIKLWTDTFDGESFKKIRGEKNRDELTAVWVELLAFAGRCDAGGRFCDPHGEPYTVEEIAKQICRKSKKIEKNFEFFLKNKMIFFEKNNFFGIENWDKYQAKISELSDEEKAEKRRESNRNSKRRSRERHRSFCGNEAEGCQQKNADSVLTVMLTCQEKESTKEKEEDSKNIDNSILSIAREGNDDTFDTRELYERYVKCGPVIMSEDELCDLAGQMSYAELEHYLGVVADCEESGKVYTRRAHRDAIIEMCADDRAAGIGIPRKPAAGSFNTRDFFTAAVRRSFKEYGQNEGEEK